MFSKASRFREVKRFPLNHICLKSGAEIEFQLSLSLSLSIVLLTANLVVCMRACIYASHEMLKFTTTPWSSLSG